MAFVTAFSTESDGCTLTMTIKVVRESEVFSATHAISDSLVEVWRTPYSTSKLRSICGQSLMQEI